MNQSRASEKFYIIRAAQDFSVDSEEKHNPENS